MQDLSPAWRPFRNPEKQFRRQHSLVTHRVLVSELSGQSNILSKVEDSGMASKSELKASKVWRERMGQVCTRHAHVLPVFEVDFLRSTRR